MFYITVQIPCRIDGNIRVISIHFHTEIFCHISHFNANCAQSDNSKFFIPDFRSRKILFCLFRRFRNIFFILIGKNPFDSAHNISGSKQHTRNNKLFHTIGIRTRRIKYDDSFFRTLIERNIVDTGARPRDCQQIFRQFHIVHRCTSDQNSIRFRNIIRLLISFAEFFGSYCGNGV